MSNGISLFASSVIAELLASVTLSDLIHDTFRLWYGRQEGKPRKAILVVCSCYVSLESSGAGIPPSSYRETNNPVSKELAASICGQEARCLCAKKLRYAEPTDLSDPSELEKFKSGLFRTFVISTVEGVSLYRIVRHPDAGHCVADMFNYLIPATGFPNHIVHWSRTRVVALVESNFEAEHHVALDYNTQTGERRLHLIKADSVLNALGRLFDRLELPDWTAIFRLKLDRLSNNQTLCYLGYSHIKEEFLLLPFELFSHPNGAIMVPIPEFHFTFYYPLLKRHGVHNSLSSIRYF